MNDLTSFEGILIALAELPSIPLDADEKLEGVLRNTFDFYDDVRIDPHPEEFPDQETWGPEDHYGS